MDIPHDAHILVADGRKSLLFRNSGDATRPVFDTVEHDEQDDAATHESGTDRPGRTFSGTAAGGVDGPGHRSGYEQPDHHQLAEDGFAAATAGRLKRLVLENTVRQLIVVAPPKTLGELRKHYHKQVEAALLGEIAKELTNRPPDAIAQAVAAA